MLNTALRVHTTRLPHVPDLASLMPSPSDPLVWLQDGHGFIAAGEAAQFSGTGPGRFAQASAWWKRLLDDAEMRDPLQLDGTGMLAVGSFAFAADSPAGSVLRVPQVVVGISDGIGWITFIGPQDRDVYETLSPDAMALVDAAIRGTHFEYADHGRAQRVPDAADFRDTVRAAKAAIEAGRAQKVVAARSVEVRAERQIDQRRIVAGLAADYPSCATFAVDGLVGASPELLARTRGREVFCQVLAGTLPASRDDAELLASHKDRVEHQFAVDSAIRELEKIAAVTKSEPHILRLSNVIHLATDIHATLNFDATSLDVAGQLHPTAALGGTPTLAALEIIAELEADRGRYGAPVGWMDARGGQWHVALRCAQIDGQTARAYAGGGIVADSDPDAELAETEAKLAPMLGALGV